MNMISKSLIIIILFLAITSAGCLQKNMDLPDTDKEPEKIVPVEGKEDRELEKTVPVEYYVDENRSAGYYSNFYYNPAWLSKFNITEEEGNEIIAQCRKAFEYNAEKLAREIPTKIPENWIRDEVQLKKEDFLMENDTASLKKFDDKVVARFHRIIEHNVNSSAFSLALVSIYIENNCVYNLKEKKVEKIRITFNPEIHTFG